MILVEADDHLSIQLMKLFFQTTPIRDFVSFSASPLSPDIFQFTQKMDQTCLITAVSQRSRKKSITNRIFHENPKLPAHQVEVR